MRSLKQVIGRLLLTVSRRLLETPTQRYFREALSRVSTPDQMFSPPDIKAMAEMAEKERAS